MTEPRKVDIDEVRDMRNQILREMKNGFDGVHERQDLTNGRILNLEKEQGGLEARTEALELALRESVHVHRRATDPTPVIAPPPADSEEKPVRRWDVILVLGTGGLLYAIVKFLQWVQPALPHAGKP